METDLTPKVAGPNPYLHGPMPSGLHVAKKTQN